VRIVESLFKKTKLKAELCSPPNSIHILSHAQNGQN